MTTLVQMRNPLDTLSMNPQPTRRRSTRLKITAYDEEDGDFQFTRGSKRKKIIPSIPESVVVPAPDSTSRKRKAPQDEPPQIEEKKRSRRKMSFSTPNQENDSIKLPKRATRRSTRLSAEKSGSEEETRRVSGVDIVEVVEVVEVVGEPALNGVSAMMIEKESTKIALPFSDTPVINRNKELRRKGTGGRRSSLGLRGRRASSLIDSGHSATPHQQVETSQFYKHIEAEGLSEPRRMKQLLTWCGERALGERPSHNIADSAAVLAARAIQESILKDFTNRSEMSDWFNREDTQRSVVVRKPNPLNIKEAEDIRNLEERIKQLQEERQQWKMLMQPPTPLPTLFDPSEALPTPSSLDPTLLDGESAEILAFISNSSCTDLISQTTARVKKVQEGLEFQVDQFADGIHKLEQAQKTMERVANKVLALSAVRLEEREREEKEAVGTRDMPIQEVLRSLSRIMPTGTSR